MGALLRRELADNGWRIINETELPVVCIVDGREDGAAHSDAILNEVLASGRAWISTTRLGNGQHVLRACVTNYLTDEADVRALVATLHDARNMTGAPQT